MKRSAIFVFLLLLAVFMVPAFAAEQGIPALTVTPAADGTETWSLSLQTLFLMTAITLLPAAMLALTSFTRIIIVLAMLRTALGTGQTPSNQILIGLTLFMTLFIMQPVFATAWVDAIQPYLDGTVGFIPALQSASVPFREFMMGQVRESDLLLFTELSGSQGFATPEDVPFQVLAASFLTSELKTAFSIGFYLFIPFVVIDLVVASVLMSMGMMMLSPMLISAPFKIMLFVLVDGWALVLGSLAASFGTIQ